MHSGTQTNVNDGSGSGKHVQKHVAFVNGTSKVSSSVHSKLPRENKAASIEMGGNCLECHPLISTKELEASSSSSSLSDISEFFQVDDSEGVKKEACTNPSTKSHENFQLEMNADESDIPISSSIESGNINVVSHGTTLPAMSPIQSPETQKMDHPEGYDPFRIPSSVFDRSKSSTPVDWSVASNESLFSIHVGNSSFSRDHVLMLGDLGKSGEIPKYGELFALNPSPQVPKVESREKNVETINESVVAQVKAEIVQDEKTSVEYQHERKSATSEVSYSSNASQQSDGSGTSAHSFAFPIYEDGKNSSFVVEDEKPQESRVIVKPHKSKPSRWFACFSCCNWGWSCCRSWSCRPSCSSCGSCSFCHCFSNCRSCFSKCQICPSRHSCSCRRSCSCFRRCSCRRCCCC